MIRYPVLKNQPVKNYTVDDVYQDLYNDLQIPIVYDIDCGHVPPQITLVNGAVAEVEVKDGKGKILQSFCRLGDLKSRFLLG